MRKSLSKKSANKGGRGPKIVKSAPACGITPPWPAGGEIVFEVKAANVGHTFAVGGVLNAKA